MNDFIKIVLGKMLLIFDDIFNDISNNINNQISFGGIMIVQTTRPKMLC